MASTTIFSISQPLAAPRNFNWNDQTNCVCICVFVSPSNSKPKWNIIFIVFAIYTWNAFVQSFDVFSIGLLREYLTVNDNNKKTGQMTNLFENRSDEDRWEKRTLNFSADIFDNCGKENEYFENCLHYSTQENVPNWERTPWESWKVSLQTNFCLFSLDQRKTF